MVITKCAMLLAWELAQKTPLPRGFLARAACVTPAVYFGHRSHARCTNRCIQNCLDVTYKWLHPARRRRT